MSVGRKYYIFLGSANGPIPLNKNLFKSTVEKFFQKTKVTKIDIRHTQGNKYHAFVTINSQRLYRAILRSNSKYIAINGGKWNIYNYVTRSERNKKEQESDEEDLINEELENEELENEELENEDLEKEDLEKEDLEKEDLEKEDLEKEDLEKEDLENEQVIEVVNEYKSPYSFIQTKKDVDAFESVFKDWSELDTHITLGKEIEQLLQWCLKRHVFL
jgi:hypothetical protein